MSAAVACRRLALPLFRLGAPCWSSWQPELPSLKAALRAIYKQVHPDLFQDYQPAKEANTRSFKLLHEYMEAAQMGVKVPLPYRFHFFVRSNGSAAAARSPAAAAAAIEAAAGSGLPAGMREVVLTLPPPTRGVPGETMSGATRKAFGRLLAALGLPSRYASGGEDDAAAADEYIRLVSLRDFLPRAVEAVHRHAAVQSSAQHQLVALRTALRLGRHIMVGFGEPAASDGVLRQLSLLQQLVAVLDSLPPMAADLSGLKLLLGQASGVDALGTVWLAADGSQEAWARHIGSVDAVHCRQRQQLLQQVKVQEGAVAAALGLAMVYPQQQEARLAPEYRHALERLAAAATERGPASGGRFRELPLMLRLLPASDADTSDLAGSNAGGEATPRSSGSSRDKLGGCAADSGTGLLVAPLAVTGDQLYAAVQQLGGQVLVALQRRRRQEQELSTLRTQVEHKVMLRRLLRHPAVPDAQYRSCLDRMLGNAQKLSGLLHGTAVRVAEVNALSPDLAVIDIAWNWRL